MKYYELTEEEEEFYDAPPWELGYSCYHEGSSIEDYSNSAKDLMDYILLYASDDEIPLCCNVGYTSPKKLSKKLR